MSGATVSGKLIDAAISRGPAALLKAEGFRKQGRHFFRVTTDAVAHVTFQASQWNVPERASFTLNLYAYLPALAEASGEVPVAEPIKQRVPHAGSRIGHLLPQRTDYWWKVASLAEVDGIAQEVTSALRDHGLPYLNRISNLEGVAELSGWIAGIANDPTKPKALALRLLGRAAEANAVEEQLRLREEKFRARRRRTSER